MNKNLILEAALTEDITKNGEGLDKTILREAFTVDESEFSAPLDGADFLMQLAKEGLV